MGYLNIGYNPYSKPGSNREIGVPRGLRAIPDSRGLRAIPDSRGSRAMERVYRGPRAMERVYRGPRAILEALEPYLGHPRGSRALPGPSWVS